MATATELRDFLVEVREQMTTLADECEGTLSDDEQARWDQLDAWEREADAEHARLEERRARLEEIRSKPELRDEPKPGDLRDKGVNVNVRTDPFDLSTLPAGEARSSDLRARALDVIEKHVPKVMPDAVREGATRTAERRTTRRYNADEVNAAIVETTSPEYLRAFEDYIKNPSAGPGRLAEFRASMSLTAANGGVLVPQWLDPTIVLTNDGAENDVRQLARIEQITVDQADFVTSAGVTAEWLAENTEAADATPTFVGPTVTAHKEAAFLAGSYEVLADSGFDEVGGLISDAFDRLEQTAHATGTGSGQPYGLITRLSGTGPVVNGTSGAAGAADFVAADVYALKDALAPRWRRNAKFLANDDFYSDVRAATDTRENYWVDFAGADPSKLIGFETYRNDAMDTTVVSGSNDYVLLLGDFKQYVIADRVGTSIMFIPTLFGANQRPNGSAGWFAYKRTGADVLTSNAFKLLKL